MVYDPGVVDVFDAVDDWAAGDGEGGLVGVGVWGLEAAVEGEVEGECGIGGEVGGGEMEVVVCEGCRG